MYGDSAENRKVVAGQSQLSCKRHSHIARNIAKNDLAPHRCEVIFCPSDTSGPTKFVISGIFFIQHHGDGAALT